MLLFSYAPAGNQALGRFRAILGRLADVFQVEAHDSLAGLARRLRSPGPRPAAALLLLGGEMELEELHAMRALLDGIRRVLILPESSLRGWHKLFSLRPSFYCFDDADLDQVEMVLRKIHRVEDGAEAEAQGAGR